MFGSGNKALSRAKIRECIKPAKDGKPSEAIDHFIGHTK